MRETEWRDIDAPKELPWGVRRSRNARNMKTSFRQGNWKDPATNLLFQQLASTLTAAFCRDTNPRPQLLSMSVKPLSHISLNWAPTRAQEGGQQEQEKGTTEELRRQRMPIRIQQANQRPVRKHRRLRLPDNRMVWISHRDFDLQALASRLRDQGYLVWIHQAYTPSA